MHGAVGLVDTPSGAFVWCGWCWCCVAGGGPVVGQSCCLPSGCSKPPVRGHHTPRQTKCLGTPFPAQQQGILPPNQTHRFHPPSIPLRAGQSRPCWVGGRLRVVLIEQPGCRAAVLPADQPSLTASPPAASLHGSQRHWFQPGGPRPLRRCDSGGPKEPLPRVAASSNGQPLFKGCMNTLIGGIAKFT